MSAEKIAAEEYGDGNALSYRPGSSVDTPLDVDDRDKALSGPDEQPESLAGPFAKGQQVGGTISNVVDIPWKYRIPAFCLILVWGTGASFADVTIGPLKSTLIKQLGINSEIASSARSTRPSTSQTPSILPIVGGVTMDYYGGVRTALGFSACCVVGSILAALSASTGKVGLLLGGRVLLGLGSVVVETTQYKLYTHWFSGSTLGLIIAIDLAWISVTSVCARLAAVPMSRLNGWYGYALWIPVAITVTSWLAVLGYFILEKRLSAQYRPSNGLARRQKGMGGWKGVKHAVSGVPRLPIFFWVFAGTELFQNSASTVYSANLADMQEKTRGTSTLAAGYNASLQNVVSIVLGPLVGLFIDRFGWRSPFFSISAALFMVVFALIGLTKVNPTGIIVLSSIALPLNVLPCLTAIPCMIPNEEVMGPAFGTWSAFIACNNVIMEIAAGCLQDSTPGKSYDRVIYFLIAVKAVQFCLGPIYDYLDGIWLGHSLRRNEKRRIELKEEMQARGDMFKGWRVSRKAFFIFGGQLGLMILTSWVLYLVYTVGGARIRLFTDARRTRSCVVDM